MAKIEIEITVDDKGTATIRRLGEETKATGHTAQEAGQKGAQGFTQFGSSVEKTTRQLHDLITPANLAAAALGTALAASLKAAVSSSTQFADEIHQLRLLTGSTTRELVALSDVAGDVGGSFEDVRMVLLRLADPSEEVQQQLRAMGVTAKDGVGKLLQYAQVIGGVTDATQRAGLVSDQFSIRLAGRLLPIFERLSGGTKSLAADTNTLADVYDDKAVAALRNFGIALGNTGDDVLTLQGVLAKDLLPSLNLFISGFQTVLQLFAMLPGPARIVIEVLGGTAIAIYAVNTALSVFGVTGFAMFGPAGWIAAAVAGIAVLIASVDDLTGKLTRAWELFKQRGLVDPHATSPTAPPAEAQSSLASTLTIPSKAAQEADAAIRKQIETLKAQRIEMESGTIAALKYSLAHGEMAKASPKLKTELIALTQSIEALTRQEDMQAAIHKQITTAMEAETKQVAELELKLLDLEKAARLNASINPFAGYVTVLSDAEERLNDLTTSLRDERNLLKERLDLLQKMGRVMPTAAQAELNTLTQKHIGLLQEERQALVKSFGEGAGLVNTLDTELLSLNASLQNTKSLSGAIQDVFGGILDVLSLFGVKLGKFILLLQQVPRAFEGITRIASGVSGLFGLLSATPAAAGLQGAPNQAAQAVAQLGAAATGASAAIGGMGQVSMSVMGVFGSLGSLLLNFGSVILAVIQALGSITTLGAIGGSPGAAVGNVFSSINTLMSGFSNFSNMVMGSMASTIQSVFNFFGAGTGGIFGAGGFQGGVNAVATALPGLAAQWVANAIPIAGAIVNTVLSFVSGNIAGGIGSAIGSVGGFFVGGPIGAVIGSFVGKFLGGLFGGLFSGPKPEISGRVRLNPTDLTALLATQFATPGQVVNPPGRSNFSFLQAGPLLLELFKHRTKGALDRDETQATIVNIILKTLQAAFSGLDKLALQLPQPIQQKLSDRIADVLASGFEITDFKLKGGNVVKKFQEFAKELSGDVLQTVAGQVFGDVDLLALGAGDATKGFDALLLSMTVFSTILDSMAEPIDASTVSLEEFANASVEFFQQFQKEEEELTDTIGRISQAFASLQQLRNSLQSSISALSGDSQSGLRVAMDQMTQAQDQILQLADTLVVLAATHSQPDEVFQLAQQLFDAIQRSLQATVDLATTLRSEVGRLQQSQVDAVDVLADLTQQIVNLGGASEEAIARLNSTITAIRAGATGNASALISLFASRLQSDLAAFALGGKSPFFAVEFGSGPDETLGRPTGGGLVPPTMRIEPISGPDTIAIASSSLNDLFLDIFAAIRTSTDPEAAIENLNQLAQAIQSGLADAIAIVQNTFAQRRQALEEASQLRIEALEAERTLIEQNFQERQEALEAELELAQQYASVIENTKRLRQDLFSLLAPLTPTTSLDTIRTQFRQSLSAFQAAPSADAATQVQELARQVLSLAQQTPGFELPSAAFRALTDEIAGALNIIEQVTSALPSQEEIQQRIAELSQEQIDSLASLDARIETENEMLRQQLENLSLQEQAEIRHMQQVVAEDLLIIRDELIRQMGLLQVQQQQATASLQQLLGGLTYDEFIANTQAQALEQLRHIDQTLNEFLARLTTHALPIPSPPVPAREGGSRASASTADKQTVVNVTVAPTIYLSGGESEADMRRNLDRTLADIISGPSLSKAAFNDLAKRAAQ